MFLIEGGAVGFSRPSGHQAIPGGRGFQAARKRPPHRGRVWGPLEHRLELYNFDFRDVQLSAENTVSLGNPFLCFFFSGILIGLF